MGKKSNKKGKSAKGKKTSFRLLDLPTELIENICEILKAQDRKKSLAVLNVASKTLREITARFLWESVRWTLKTWNAKLYCSKGVPEIFSFVKHITLVSDVRKGDDNGWNQDDEAFWAPLFSSTGATDPRKTFGQLVHSFFPNLKYAVALSLSPTSGRSSTKFRAGMYISDENLIEQYDTQAFRQMIFDTSWGLHRGRGGLRSFAEVKDKAEFRADRLNVLAFGESPTTKTGASAGASSLERVGRPESKESAILAYRRFRNVAAILVDDVTLELHLVTATDPDGMRSKMRGKVIDMMAMTNQLLTEDRVPLRRQWLQLVLEGESPLKCPIVEVRSFDLVTEWMKDIARHQYSQPRDEADTPDQPFDLSVQMLETFTVAQFQENAVALHQAMTQLHAESLGGFNTRLPITIVINAFYDIRRPLESGIIARMDFTMNEVATAVFFGRARADRLQYSIFACHQNGEMVQDEETVRRLSRFLVNTNG